MQIEPCKPILCSRNKLLGTSPLDRAVDAKGSPSEPSNEAYSQCANHFPLVTMSKLRKIASAPCLQDPKLKQPEKQLSSSSKIATIERVIPPLLSPAHRRALQQAMLHVPTNYRPNLITWLKTLQHQSKSEQLTFRFCRNLLSSLQAAAPLLPVKSILNYPYWHHLMPKLHSLGERQQLVLLCWRNILMRTQRPAFSPGQAMDLLDFLSGCAARIDSASAFQHLPAFFPSILSAHIEPFELRHLLYIVLSTPHGPALLQFCQQTICKPFSVKYLTIFLEKTNQRSQQTLQMAVKTIEPLRKSLEQYDTYALVLCGLMYQRASEQQSFLTEVLALHERSYWKSPNRMKEKLLAHIAAHCQYRGVSYI